ncbi:MAG: chemotaxis protein CheW [Christensenellales bacterium]|jgi:purine-binding chemotaxis protein CheW
METNTQTIAAAGRYLTFNVGKECFGVDIGFVVEIIGVQTITRIPEVPAYIKGIINLRGSIIPVIDMRMKFGLSEKEYGERTCIIVIDIGGLCAGIIVEGVSDVLDIKSGDIVPPPDNKSGAQNRYINGIAMQGDEVRLLIDCERLFDEDETSGLEMAANAGA